MGVLPLLPIVRQDIRDVLAYTLQRYGRDKAREYAELGREALLELARDPRSGHRRIDIHPDAWVDPIKKPGRNARHLFLYEVVESTAHIYGFIYGGRDLPAQWQDRSPQ